MTTHITSTPHFSANDKYIEFRTASTPLFSVYAMHIVVARCIPIEICTFSSSLSLCLNLCMYLVNGSLNTIYKLFLRQPC